MLHVYGGLGTFGGPQYASRQRCPEDPTWWGVGGGKGGCVGTPHFTDCR